MDRGRDCVRGRGRGYRGARGAQGSSWVRGGPARINNSRDRPQPPEKVVTVKEIEELFIEMSQEMYSGNISDKILELREPISQVLNEDLIMREELSMNIFRVITKASFNMKLEQSFRDVLSLVLETQFARKTIDSLISVYLPSSRNIGMMAAIVSFFKVAFELYPGVAFDMFHLRIANMKVLFDIPYFKTSMSEELLLEVEELMLMLEFNNPNKKIKEERRKEYMDDQCTRDDFRAKGVFPTTAELLNCDTDIFLRENRSQGTYESVDDYLDVQFRLMYEDFVQPLREGLKGYKDDANKRSFNIRAYKNVRILNSAPSRRLGIIHYVQLDKARLRRIKWSQSKRLLYGSLLCFSSDNFETLMFATVANRDYKDINEGILAVKFVGKVPPDDEEYTLIETMNMFESCKYVLAKLQETNEDNLAMKRYLVFAETEISRPSYLTTRTSYSLDYDVLRPGDPNWVWPSPSRLRMNESQFQAFRSALTKELTIIQGPPGTGKTYLGLKICKCLVQNTMHSSSAFGPILVVCYTNHALDQFLEGILEFTEEVVRVGGQSKSEIMEKFSLGKVKEKESPKLFKRRKWEIHQDISYLEMVYERLRTPPKSMVRIACLRTFMSADHCRYFDDISMEAWLSGQCRSPFTTTSYNLVEDEVERIMYDVIEETLGGIVEEVLKSRVNEADDDFDDDSDTEVNYIKNQRILDDDKEDVAQLTYRLAKVQMVPMRKNPEVDRDQVTIKSKFMKSSLVKIVKMTQEDVDAVKCLDDLTLEDRWRLYKYWRCLYVRSMRRRLEVYEKEYEGLTKQLNNVSFEEDEYLMKTKQIIGMTTTGAARYRSVLDKVGCKIIIVEEAAEVLESHIIGSLNSQCQHLILLGDHKQLRPSPAVYKLATKYHLDLSLFERLINNKLDYNTLSVQHRMRPEIADIVRFIYKDLEDAPAVFAYPDVPSMKKNLFFFNHSVKEDHSDDILSYSNRFEAEFIVKMCFHLLQNGVGSDKITILTLYSGQLFLLKSLMDKKLFQGVRVCVVDNYQGEENDVIILSLVRSNDEQRIGFVGIDNRICVSLSRAKHGLYVFGNFDLLSSMSMLWQKICRFVMERGCMGTCLDMYCQNHPEKRLVAATAEDFKKYPDCGCEELCNRLLECGHICTRYCHFLDNDHKEYNCMYKCNRDCPEGHRCKLLCHEDCKNCMVQVEKVIPDCQHKQLMACHKDPNRKDCTTTCEKVLCCGHTCTRLCGEVCGQCLTMVMKVSPACGHTSEYECFDRVLQCLNPCETVLKCDHSCKGTCSSCHNGRLHLRCDLPCTKTLICGHICKGRCSDPCYPCQDQCDDGCWHVECKRDCGDKCNPCEEPCLWRCQHLCCTLPCKDLCNRDRCDQRCSNTLACAGCGGIFQCYCVCGERCRPMCSSCDSTIKEGLIYITLWTCGHVFEVAFMDSYVDDSSQGAEIVRRSCPTCQVKITMRSSNRYMNVIKEIVSNIKAVHIRIYEEISSFKYSTFRETLDSNERNLHCIFEKLNVCNYLFRLGECDFFHDAYFRCSELHRHLLAYRYQTSLSLLVRLYKDVISATGDIINRYSALVIWLNPNDRKFDKSEMEAFNTECNSINDSIKSIDRAYKYLLYETIGRMVGSVTSPEIVSKVACSPVEEKVFYARNVRWFKCQTGHVFVGERSDLLLSPCPQCLIIPRI